MFIVHTSKCDAVIENFSFLGRKKTDEAFHEHRLAGAAFTNDKIGMAALERSIYIEENALPVKPFAYVSGLYHCSRSLVRITSISSINMELDTTAEVDALPTSSAPPDT